MHTICPLCYQEVDENHNCVEEQWEEPTFNKKKKYRQPYKQGGRERARKK